MIKLIKAATFTQGQGKRTPPPIGTPMTIGVAGMVFVSMTPRSIEECQYINEHIESAIKGEKR